MQGDFMKKVLKQPNLTWNPVNEAAIRAEGLLVNPKNPKLKVKVSFLIDTGADGSMISQKLAKKLGLEPIGTVGCELADGTEISIDLAYAYINIAGEGVFALVGIAPANDFDPLLGFDIMEVLQLQIDITNKRLLKPWKRIKFIKMTLNRWGRINAKKHD